MMFCIQIGEHSLLAPIKPFCSDPESGVLYDWLQETE
jgi:hypothetical protein